MNAKKTKASPDKAVEIREIWPAATEVKIKNLALHGIITSVILTVDSVMYRVNYWNDGELKIVDLHEFEFVATGTKHVFGFKTKDRA